jgi:bifunctional non-homologous end joining protein LigD
LLDYAAVIAGAHAIREVFAQAKLESFVKTTGGKGLHVCVPIAPELGWEPLKAFTGHIAWASAQRSPELYVTTQSKARRNGKAFIDYLRNARGATFIASYSTRARENVPLAIPLEWDELSPKLLPTTSTCATCGAGSRSSSGTHSSTCGSSRSASPPKAG